MTMSSVLDGMDGMHPSLVDYLKSGSSEPEPQVTWPKAARDMRYLRDFGKMSKSRIAPSSSGGPEPCGIQ